MKISIKTGAVALLAILGSSSIALHSRAACNPPSGQQAPVLSITGYSGGSIHPVVEAASQGISPVTCGYYLSGTMGLTGTYSWSYAGFDYVGGGGSYTPLIFLKPGSTPQITKIKCTFTPTGSDWSGNCSAEYEIAIVKLESEAVATIPADRKRARVGVCEKVKLTLEPSPSGVTWYATGGSSIDATGSPVTFTAASTKVDSTVTATYKGYCFRKTFEVVAPYGEDYVLQTDLNSNFIQGVEAGTRMICSVTLKPIDVSFVDLMVGEEDGDVVEQSGYFGQHPSGSINHTPGNPAPVNAQNKFTDDIGYEVGMENGTNSWPSWSEGRLWLSIPAFYEGSDGFSYTYGNAYQIMTIKINGYTTASKQMGSGLLGINTRLP